MDKSKWPELTEIVADVIKTKTRDQWCELMEGSDICFAPVLDLIEAQSHPHNVERKTYVEIGGMQQPAPAPRFSRTEPRIEFAARPYGKDTDAVLQEMGYSEERIKQLRGEKTCS